jgi:hypothetical protein
MTRSSSGRIAEAEMKNIFPAVLLAPALAALLASHSATAQPATPAPEQVCLQNNRIWSWNAVNDRLLIVTDRTYRRYIVRLSGGCIGLSSYALTALRFNSWTSLGCLQRGDTVAYRAPGLGPLNCFVNEVQAYSPELLAEDEHHK